MVLKSKFDKLKLFPLLNLLVAFSIISTLFAFPIWRSDVLSVMLLGFVIVFIKIFLHFSDNCKFATMLRLEKSWMQICATFAIGPLIGLLLLWFLHSY